MMPDLFPPRNGEFVKQSCSLAGSTRACRSLASGAEAVGPIQSVQNLTGIEQSEGDPTRTAEGSLLRQTHQLPTGK